MLRTGKWKFIRFTDDPPELYNLEEDPGEFTNVAQAPENRKLVEEFTQQLLDHAMNKTALRQPYSGPRWPGNQTEG